MDLRYAKRSEDTEQIKVIQWSLRAQNEFPALKWLHHIPNGGKRNKSEAEKLKQMGVKAGVSDLRLPYPSGCYHGMYIEMKYESNKPTKEQIEFLTFMQEEGYFVCVCYSFEAAQEIIVKYLQLYERQILNTTMLEKKHRYNDKGILIIE